MQIRPATPEDSPVLFDLVLALAEYERLSHAVTGCVENLNAHLFGSRSYAEAILAELDGQVVGFALFFYTYSTLLTKPGIYLQDLFVLPQYRRQKIGTALLTYLAQRVVAEGGGRLEWSVLDWNASAIAFYEQMGATILPEWRICRVVDDSLTRLANPSG
jgi:GNAT superfamily N-acetyltransferase